MALAATVLALPVYAGGKDTKKVAQDKPDSTSLTVSIPKQVSSGKTDEMMTAPDPLPSTKETAAIPETTTVPEEPCPCVKEAETSANVLKILIFDDIFFNADETETPSLTFNSNYLITLNKVVKALKSNPEINIRLKGHAMNTDPKSGKSRMMSQKRAITVGKLILGLFPEEEKESIANRIEIVPVGADEMLIEGDNQVKELLNHRVSIELFIGEVNEPTLADFMFHKKESESRVVSVAPQPVQQTKPARPKSRSVSQEGLYENGNIFFKQKKYEDAINAYTEFISINPQHRLADNAQWWIGECYYFLGDYTSALNAYQKVFGLGDGNKSAYAQLRMGYCYNRMNQLDMAISAWEKVIRDYPDAVEEVTKAKKAIQVYSGNIDRN